MVSESLRNAIFAILEHISPRGSFRAADASKDEELGGRIQERGLTLCGEVHFIGPQREPLQAPSMEELLGAEVAETGVADSAAAAGATVATAAAETPRETEAAS
eukprot:1610730-Alexandrium_andersonii.AAC.1